MEWKTFSFWYLLLFFIFHSSSSSTTAGPQCLPDECSALLQLKSSFPIVDAPNPLCLSKYIRRSSWSKNTNCCKWDGITCDNVTGHVIGLDLGCSRLKGPIRSNSSLFFLQHLQILDLYHNDFSGSPILPEFGQFKNMTSLDLSGSNFSGNVPLELSHLSKLVYLRIGDYAGEEKFSMAAATLKALAQNLTYLSELWLSGINMSMVPLVSLMNLSSSLTSLELSYCQLHGKLPENIFQSNKLSRLALEGNYLSGQIPWSSLSRQPLSSLILSDNNFVGQLPEVYNNSTQNFSSYDSSEYPLASLPPNLMSLDLASNSLNGTISSWIVLLPSVNYLDIGDNHLTGEIPKFHSTLLQYLYLERNKLHGTIPASLPDLTVILLSKNQFAGEIPNSFCSMTYLYMLDLSYNNLHGTVPPCIENLSRTLAVLNLQMNRFHGRVPPAFGKGCRLKTFNINGNQLEGSLSRSLLNCEDLEVLDVGDNKINGSFPQWLESLPKLQVLILKSNRFYGPISNPMVRFPFQKLRIIDLSHNEFTGQLPTRYLENFGAMMDARTDHLEYMEYPGPVAGKYYENSVMLVIKGSARQLEKILIIFTTIDLSSNNFQGEIPKSIGKLRSLKGLNFSHNRLSGLIPPSLGNLNNLEWLDLSSNKLSGNIPLELAADLNQLAKLNLSNNKLEGPIPRGTQFNTFNGDSYSGNPGLCGFPLPACDDDKAQQDEGEEKGDEDVNDSGMIDWKVVMMGYGSGLVIGVSVGYMVLFSRGFDYWFSKRFGGRPWHKPIAPLRGQRRN